MNSNKEEDNGTSTVPDPATTSLDTSSDRNVQRNSVGPASIPEERNDVRRKDIHDDDFLWMPWLGIVIWPLMLTVPLLLSSKYSFTSYADLFPSSWYEYDSSSMERPTPLGLSLGIFAVAVGQVFVVAFFYLYRNGFFHHFHNPPPVQAKGAPQYEFWEGVRTHFSQPEGFVLLTAYLSGTWMFRLMPSSYYSFSGGIQWLNLMSCLVIQDGVQFTMHRLEHAVSADFYRRSHKPHHKFTNPRLFDAFNGSVLDTIFMILVPLYITALSVPCNVWTYMAFGSTYANWLVLIHSEYPLPWDKYFRRFGLGTPGDHHVHHKFFKYNYGHLFMWFDWIVGTYRNPEEFVGKTFSPEV